MADTLGGLIDKLITINLKIQYNELNQIRKLSRDDFINKYYNRFGANKIWILLQTHYCLDLQKKQLLMEIQDIIDEMIVCSKTESLDNGKFIQLKHKTY